MVYAQPTDRLREKPFVLQTVTRGPQSSFDGFWERRQADLRKSEVYQTLPFRGLCTVLGIDTRLERTEY